jgi:hypothetical protein
MKLLASSWHAVFPYDQLLCYKLLTSTCNRYHIKNCCNYELSLQHKRKYEALRSGKDERRGGDQTTDENNAICMQLFRSTVAHFLCWLISLLVRDPLQMEFSKRSTTNRKPIFSGNSNKNAVIPMGNQSTLGNQITTLTGFLKAFSRSQAGVLMAT